MDETARLERWYRRLLAWFPAEHRRTYGEEMIGVLLASAPQGRRRPGTADTLDLIKGGLLARLRPAGGIDAGWRDTFAVFSITAPVAAVGYILVTTALGLINSATNDAQLGFIQAVIIENLAEQAAFVVLAVAVPLLLALLTLRRTAVVVAAVPAILVGYKAVEAFVIAQASPYPDVYLVWYSLFFVLQAITLAISAGPRRGAALMTWPAWAITAAGAVLVGLSTYPTGQVPFEDAVGTGTIALAVIVTAVAAGLLLALAAPIGARLLLLLVILIYPAAITFTGIGAVQPNGDATRYSLEVIYLPAFALICLVGVLAWRSRTRGSAAS